MENFKTLKTQMIEESKRVFKPEFLNRFDDIIVFRPPPDPKRDFSRVAAHRRYARLYLRKEKPRNER